MLRAGKNSLGVLVLAGSLAGCAALSNGGTQTVDVIVKGSPTAYCELTTSVFRNAGHFPNKVTLERSREPLMVDCKGEQNRHTAFEVKPVADTKKTLAGNAATGVLPGALYDLTSGATFSYPDPLIVDFRTVGDGPKPQWPEDTTVDSAARGTADIARPEPVHMRPVLDDQLDPSMGGASARPQKVYDAATLAIESTPPPAGAGYSRMKPVLSPEDEMGADPAAAKAKAAKAAKAKAAKAAKAAARKKAEAEAAREAAQPAQNLPEAAESKAPDETATPSQAKAPEDKTLENKAPENAPAPSSPSSAPSPAPAAPRAQENAPTAKKQENAAPAPAQPSDGAQKIEADKYLTGDGQ